MIYDALHDLVPLVYIKKREKFPWRGVKFSKVTEDYNSTKINTPPYVFFSFFKLYNTLAKAREIFRYPYDS